MRTFACALALLTLAAACRRAPAGAVRLGIGAETRAQGYDADGALTYLRGDYPRKNYFCVFDVASGKEKSYHYADHRLLAPSLRIARLDRAVLTAEYKPGDTAMDLRGAQSAALYGQSRPESTETEQRLLIIGLGDGALIKELRLAAGAAPLLIAMPTWSDKAFVVLKTDRQTLLKAFDPRTGGADDAAPIADFPADAAAFSDARPVLALAAKDGEGRGRVVLYDLAARRKLAESALDAPADELRASPDGFLARLTQPGEVKSVVVRVALADGRVRRLGVVEDGAETMLEAGGRVLVVGRDPSRPDPANQLGYHPRVLTELSDDGAPPRRLVWTKRAGRFLGADERTGTLYFLATEPTSAWAFGSSPEALLGAARTLDDRAGEFFGTDPLSWVVLALGAVLLITAWKFWENWPTAPQKPRKY